MIVEVLFSPELVLGCLSDNGDFQCIEHLHEPCLQDVLSADRVPKRVLGCLAEEGSTGYSYLPPRSAQQALSLSYQDSTIY